MHPGAPAHPLDNPAWSSLTGPHAALAEGRATARRYRSGMSPFAAIASEHDIEAWAELRTLVTPGETVILFGSQLLPRAHGIRERCETPLLHVAATNENAIRLYRAIGFSPRRDFTYTFLSRHV